MNIALFTTDLTTVKTFEERVQDFKIEALSDPQEVAEYLQNNSNGVIIADYDSVSHDVNSYIQSDALPKNLVVLEKEPNLITGTMLISKGIRAYGNINMLSIHLDQLIKTVVAGKVWTYPQLTAYMVKKAAKKVDYSDHELLNRLSEKERDVALLILDGLNNSAISKKLDITERTVKAHISAIFKKLHINDRISLVLLLK